VLGDVVPGAFFDEPGELRALLGGRGRAHEHPVAARLVRGLDHQLLLGFVDIDGQLAGGPWLLGERFLAVDVLWGNALSWATGNGLLEQTPHIDAYVERFEARPATRRVRAEDAARIEAQQLLASHAH
jgi:glutathione S-transferase